MKDSDVPGLGIFNNIHADCQTPFDSIHGPSLSHSCSHTVGAKLTDSTGPPLTDIFDPNVSTTIHIAKMTTPASINSRVYFPTCGPTASI